MANVEVTVRILFSVPESTLQTIRNDGKETVYTNIQSKHIRLERLGSYLPAECIEYETVLVEVLEEKDICI